MSSEIVVSPSSITEESESNMKSLLLTSDTVPDGLKIDEVKVNELPLIDAPL